MRREDGFTLIELVVAMAVFTFMLVIIVAGFINVTRLRNQSVAANIVQDNAQSLMATLVREVRDNITVTQPSALIAAPGYLCLNGGSVKYYLSAGKLYRATTTNCGAPISPPQVLSSPSVNVAYFNPTFVVGGATPSSGHPTINLSLRVATAVGTTGVGAATQCDGSTVTGRYYCNVTTVDSSASPRGNQ